MNYTYILNSRLASSINDKYPIGLADGKMGLCIYFYYLFRIEKEEKYKQVAEKLLDEVVSNLSQTMDITVESGLAGIAIGISHLVKEKFIGGNINEILEDVDNHIFRKLAFLKNEESKDKIPKAVFIQLLYYLHLRYTEQSSSDNKYIFQELIIKTIEIFKHNLQPIFLCEHFSFSVQNFYLPLFIYIFSKIYDLNIYNARIKRILEEFIDQILSTNPVLHANRLYLLWGLLHIKTCLPNYNKEIDSQINFLRERIDVDHIVNVELKNQDVYLTNGLSFVYILLFYLQTEYPEYGIGFNPQLFAKKIKNSEVWHAMLNREYYYYKHSGLFEGFPGANLALLHMKKHYP